MLDQSEREAAALDLLVLQGKLAAMADKVLNDTTSSATTLFGQLNAAKDDLKAELDSWLQQLVSEYQD